MALDRYRLGPAAALTLLLAGCAAPPDLAGRLGAAGHVTAPELVPLGPILAAADAARPATQAFPEERLARLAARAALLRRPVLSTADRARLGL